MGFLRKWYRDNCADPKERARMLLADGEYADAASEFHSCGMYKQAADAYMKAGDAGDTRINEAWHQYRSAIKCYDEAGYPDGMRLACEKCWRIDTGHVYKEDLWRLVDLRLIEPFIRNVRDHKPYWLASSLEGIGQLKYAAETYAVAAVAVDQLPEQIEPVVCLVKAVNCGIKGSLGEQQLLKIHEEFFRTAIRQPNPRRNIQFFVSNMSWLLDSDNLKRFIDDFLNKRAIFLCFVLKDLMDIIKKPIDKKVMATIANCMIRCLKEAEKVPSADPAWEVVEGKFRLYSSVSQWLSYAGMFVDAAEVLERLAKYKEAAGLAEKAGNKELAIRLYELALKEKGISDTEANWIKATLQRLRKEREKSSATGSAKPEDYM